MTEQINISKHQLNAFFLDACASGNLDAIEYWLTSPELKEHADIHTNGDNALLNACLRGNTDVVKYLTSSPSLKEYSNIHIANDTPFIYAYDRPHDDILHYFIFKLNIEKTDFISNYMKNKPYPQVETWFEQRDLYNNLQQEISLQNHVSRKIKL